MYLNSSLFFFIPTGRNVERAKHILIESGMPLFLADDMDDAARKAVVSLTGWRIMDVHRARGMTRE